MNPIETAPQNELAKIAIATIRDRGHLACFNTTPSFCSTIPINDDPNKSHVWVSEDQVVVVGRGRSFSIRNEVSTVAALAVEYDLLNELFEEVREFLRESREKINLYKRERDLERATEVLKAITLQETSATEPRIEGAYSDALAGESLELRHKYCEATETFNGVTFKDFERYARTVAYKVASNLANGHEMDWSRSPLNK
jgi:hypothetical protein